MLSGAGENAVPAAAVSEGSDVCELAGILQHMKEDGAIAAVAGSGGYEEGEQDDDDEEEEEEDEVVDTTAAPSLCSSSGGSSGGAHHGHKRRLSDDDHDDGEEEDEEEEEEAPVSDGSECGFHQQEEPPCKARRLVTDEIMTAIQALSGQEEAGVYNDRAPDA